MSMGFGTRALYWCILSMVAAVLNLFGRINAGPHSAGKANTAGGTARMSAAFLSSWLSGARPKPPANSASATVAHGAAMTVAEELVVAGRTVELVFVLQRGQRCVAAASGDLGVLSKVEARLALGALEAGCVVMLAKHLAALRCNA